MRPTMAESSENFCTWQSCEFCLKSVVQYHSLGGPYIADDSLWHTVVGGRWVRYSTMLAPACTSKCWPDGIESTGEIKGHDFTGGPWLPKVSESSVEEEDDGIFHSQARLIWKLHMVSAGQGPDVPGSLFKSHWYVEAEVLEVLISGHGYHTGCLP